MGIYLYPKQWSSLLKIFKQHTVVDFTYEAEYIMVSNAVKETMWLQKFMGELGVAPSVDGPILLYCDSTGAIAQAKEPKWHQRTKHILRCYHLAWEIMDWGDVELQKIDGKENMTDPFTKALGVKESEDYKSKMDIQYCTVGFSPSRSCWKLYLKVNHQSVDSWAHCCNYI